MLSDSFLLDTCACTINTDVTRAQFSGLSCTALTLRKWSAEEFRITWHETYARHIHRITSMKCKYLKKTGDLAGLISDSKRKMTH